MTSFREYIGNGFKVGPNYGRPAAAVGNHWIDYEDKRIQSDAEADYAWWRQFDDPRLDSLIYTAHAQNLSLREAGFRVMEARALRGIAVGELFPQSQTVNGAYTRRRTSFGTGIQAGGGAGLPGIKQHFSVWNTGAQLAWEVDFWGRFRRAVESADASLDASVENYDDVLVILISDVANAYVDIRTAEQRVRYARANVISQRNSLELAKTRLAGGTATRLDVAQAITNVAQTEATIPQFEIQLRQAENRLCVLMGMPPYDLTQVLAGQSKIPVAPPQVAVGIPADLLRRRPDVRRAEREVAAQSARIGIAESDLYPAFTINGSLFIQASQFTDLFRSSSLGGAVGPSFNWNVLNYGRIRNLVRVEEARFEQRVAFYQSTVLNANREAEDAIVSFLRAQEQAMVLAEGVAAAEESRDLVNDLYKGGRADFGRVFVAELFLTQQQDALAQAQGLIAQSMVSIYRSLGGGWEIRLENPPAFQPLPPIEEIGPGVANPPEPRP
ncbi:MAG TPA: efflux transporter outer membrane subunit [Pirellulaceae bacterium]|nr:efflux transporter outer membrane subunit [Pirellulaceae bacterium]